MDRTPGPLVAALLPAHEDGADSDTSQGTSHCNYSWLRLGAAADSSSAQLLHTMMPRFPRATIWEAWVPPLSLGARNSKQANALSLGKSEAAMGYADPRVSSARYITRPPLSKASSPLLCQLSTAAPGGSHASHPIALRKPVLVTLPS